MLSLKLKMKNTLMNIHMKFSAKQVKEVTHSFLMSVMQSKGLRCGNISWVLEGALFKAKYIWQDHAQDTSLQ